MGKRWSQEEIKLVKENYSSLKKKELLRLFKQHAIERSWISIFKKANKLGLRKPNPKASVDKILKESYSRESESTILRKIRVYIPEANWESVKMRAQRLGLSRRDYASEQMCKKIKIPVPSENLAWFLGVVAGDGHVRSLSDRSKKYSVVLGSVSPEFESAFCRTGKNLFGIDGHRYKASRYKLKGKWRFQYFCEFISKNMVAFLGDWKETVWPTTLTDNFSWILQDKNYIANFIGGFFDAEGNARKQWTKSYRIYIAIKYPAVQNTIGKMLSQLGIRYSVYSNGVWINSRKECWKFANLVKSCIPHKELLLEEMRNAYNHAR